MRSGRFAPRLIAGRLVAALAVGGLLAAGASVGASAATRPAASVRSQDTAPTWPPDYTEDTVAPVIPLTVSPTDAATWLTQALKTRVKSLGDLQSTVDASKDVSNSLQATLDALLTGDSSALDTLEVTVANANDLVTLQTVATSMVTDFRVYSLVTPEVNDLVTAETQLTAAHKLENLETSLEAAIAAAQSTKAASQLTSLRASYSRLLTKVDSEDNAIVTNLVAISPSTFAAGVNALSSVKVSLTTSQGELAQSRKLLQTILADLANPNSVNASTRGSILKLKKKAAGA